jgi:hypothetical protein
MTLHDRRNTDGRKRVKDITVIGAALLGGYAVYSGTRRYLYHRDYVAKIDGMKEERLKQLAPNGPQPGDILLFHHARDTELVVTLVTHSPFYHVALYAGDEKAVEARVKGVLCDTIADREGDYLIIPAPLDKGKEALAWAESKIGAPYDHKDMWLIVLEHMITRLHLNYTQKGKYTCAQFVAEAYKQAGVDLFPDKDVNNLIPGDFARLIPPELMPQT